MTVPAAPPMTARPHRENAETKGRRYLIEGRLWVRVAGPDGVQAFCRGSGEVYRVEWRPDLNQWDCTCPARSRCAHIVACELVTTPLTTEGWG